VTSGEHPFTLGPSEVHVWWARTEPPPPAAVIQSLLRLLDDGERDRCARFHRERDRVSFVCAHALLRVLCSRYCGGSPDSQRFGAGENGRPFLLSSGQDILDFNLTHTNGLVACGFSRLGRVGVDVESVERRAAWEDLMDRVFSPREIADLASLPHSAAQERFFELWSLKEAVAKSWGMGVGIDFRGVEIAFRDGRAELTNCPPGHPAPVLLEVHAIDDYRLSIALTDSSRRLACLGEAKPAAIVRASPLTWDGMVALR